MSFHLLTSCLPLHSQTLKKSFASTVPAYSPLIITLIHLDPCPQHSSKTVLTNLPTTLPVPAMFHSLSLWFWCGRLLAFVGNWMLNGFSNTTLLVLYLLLRPLLCSFANSSSSSRSLHAAVQESLLPFIHIFHVGWHLPPLSWLPLPSMLVVLIFENLRKAGNLHYEKAT